MEKRHRLQKPVRRSRGRLVGECRCGALIQADTVERLRELLIDHGMNAPTEPMLRPLID